MREGQSSGQLRRFAVGVVALAIRAAIDAVAYRLADEPDLDLASNERELGTRFDHARAARRASGARRSGACPLGSGKA